MKYKLKYSPDASDKLRELNRSAKENYGKPKVLIFGVSRKKYYFTTECKVGRTS